MQITMKYVKISDNLDSRYKIIFMQSATNMNYSVGFQTKSNNKDQLKFKLILTYKIQL